MVPSKAKERHLIRHKNFMRYVIKKYKVVKSLVTMVKSHAKPQ